MSTLVILFVKLQGFYYEIEAENTMNYHLIQKYIFEAKLEIAQVK